MSERIYIYWMGNPKLINSRGTLRAERVCVCPESTDGHLFMGGGLKKGKERKNLGMIPHGSVVGGSCQKNYAFSFYRHSRSLLGIFCHFQYPSSCLLPAFLGSSLVMNVSM